MPFTLTFGDQDEVKILSSLLRNKTIEYQVSDTGNNIGYKLYDSGELIERLYFSGDSENTTDEKIQRPGTCQFESQQRQLKAEDIIKDPYSFTYLFIEEQDVYIPALSWEKPKLNQSIVLRFTGYDYIDFERVDCCKTIPKFVEL